MTSHRDRIYRVDAVVLSRMDLGEADRIFSVYSSDRGKLSVIAKGVRRPTSRMAPHLEYFNRCRLMLAKGRELDVVTSAETIDAFPRLRTELDVFGEASYVVEVLNRLTQDRQENLSAFDLLVRTLRLLEEGVDSDLVVRHYELALLMVLGYKPELYRCIGCETPLLAEGNALSASLGGMLCPRCSGMDLSAPVLSVNAQKLLRTLDRQGLAAAVTLTIEASVRHEVERALSLYLRHRLERDLSSPKVMKSIREGLAPAYVVGR